MRAMYMMLSWAGWIWLVVAGSYLLLRLRREAAASAKPPVAAEHRSPSESEQSDA